MTLPVHLLTDLFAAICAALSGWVFYRYGLKPEGYTASAQRELGYWATLSFAALLGAFWFGTLNLHLGGIAGIGRSAFGAIFGGIAGVELWKAFKRRSGSTGVVYVVPLSVGMILGRIGCQFAGLEDMTYGAPTALPWAWDFGDGIGRHPSPLYESLAMAVFLAGFLIWFRRAPQAVAAIGFYVFIAYYAAQRFLIEFTKPYGELVAGLDLFQIGALLLFGYALTMIMRRRGSHAAARA
ncbi:MAG TPA: prolipoprotein diacylglyceryl transferase family protein [Dongiaceae bacterium]|nr:prolipoprotein diacylglyceryl transferase family protein [Dongiaceae bacterium]